MINDWHTYWDYTIKSIRLVWSEKNLEFHWVYKHWWMWKGTRIHVKCLFTCLRVLKVLKMIENCSLGLLNLFARIYILLSDVVRRNMKNVSKNPNVRVKTMWKSVQKYITSPIFGENVRLSTPESYFQLKSQKIIMSMYQKRTFCFFFAAPFTNTFLIRYFLVSWKKTNIFRTFSFPITWENHTFRKNKTNNTQESEKPGLQNNIFSGNFSQNCTYMGIFAKIFAKKCAFVPLISRFLEYSLFFFCFFAHLCRSGMLRWSGFYFVFAKRAIFSHYGKWESPKEYRCFDETKKYLINKVCVKVTHAWKIGKCPNKRKIEDSKEHFLGNFLRKCSYSWHLIL